MNYNDYEYEKQIIAQTSKSSEEYEHGSYNHFEALGIFQEAMQLYRETSIEAMNEENEEK